MAEEAPKKKKLESLTVKGAIAGLVAAGVTALAPVIGFEIPAEIQTAAVVAIVAIIGYGLRRANVPLE